MHPDQSPTAFAYFEIDETGEATGDVSWWCSEACRNVYPIKDLTNANCVPGTGNDYCNGAKCYNCGKYLDPNDDPFKRA